MFYGILKGAEIWKRSFTDLIAFLQDELLISDEITRTGLERRTKNHATLAELSCFDHLLHAMKLYNVTPIKIKTLLYNVIMKLCELCSSSERLRATILPKLSE